MIECVPDNILKLELVSPAKINLFLEVLSKRPDGYHELETVMTRVSIYDQMSFVIGPPGVELEVVAAKQSLLDELPVPERNLVVRVLKRLQELSGCSTGIRVQLFKRIPSKAGLGGASSNAATALLAANHLWKLGWSREELANVANEFGSDITFFLHAGSAICRGRGERVESIRCNYGWPIVVVKPEFGLSTADVFRSLAISRHLTRPDDLLASISKGSIHESAGLMFNRLEQAAGEFNGWFGDAALAFRSTNSLGAQMSGSGSCYFGIYATIANAKLAANEFRKRFPECDVFCCRTISGHSSIVPLAK